MTKIEELKAYKLALKHYQSKKPVLDRYGNIWNAYDEKACGEFYGFCWYFTNVQDNIDIKKLSTICSAHLTISRDYWFAPDDKAPRIELLKKAIKILEKELK